MARQHYTARNVPAGESESGFGNGIVCVGEFCGGDVGGEEGDSDGVGGCVSFWIWGVGEDRVTRGRDLFYAPLWLAWVYWRKGGDGVEGCEVGGERAPLLGEGKGEVV
jgi:hypothetical protein